MKKCYLISIDLKPNRSYSNFINAVKAYGTWAIITESTFAIVSESTATEIRDYLSQFLSNDDRLFVAKTGGVAAWRNIIANRDWMTKFLSL